MEDVQRGQLFNLTTEINDMLRARDYAEVDNGLNQCRERILGGEETDPVFPVARLRNTFPVKHFLKNWIPLLSTTRKYLLELGFDPERVLVGLNQDKIKTESDVLLHLFSRYEALAVQNADKLKGLPNRCNSQSLQRLCHEGAVNNQNYPSDKMFRWLGFVQGVLAVQGIIDVDFERDYTRPILHGMCKTAVPSFDSDINTGP